MRIRSFRRSLLVAAVPLILAAPAAPAFAGTHPGPSPASAPSVRDGDANPLQMVVCTLDKAHEGCPKPAEPKK